MTTPPDRIGEVLEATTTAFVAGSYTLHRPPAVGTLVAAHTPDDNRYVLGVVYDSRTAARDSGGRAVMRGRTYDGRELYDNEIYRQHPDLNEVLQTTFDVLVLGSLHDQQPRYILPTQPPPVHYSVCACPAAQLLAFTTSYDYCRLVLQSSLAHADDVLAHLINAATAARPPAEQAAYRIGAGRELARLLASDYYRLQALLHLVRPPVAA